MASSYALFPGGEPFETQCAEDNLKKRDFIVAAGALALALGLLLAVRLGLANPPWRPQEAQQDAPGITVSLSPMAESSGESPQTLYPLQPGAKRFSAIAYLLINVNNHIYEPVPLTGNRLITITQEDGRQNVVAISADTAHMSAATCRGQECIHQGQVSLENRDQRVLYNQIICLPNTVILSVLDVKEAKQIYGEAP
jgi:hypothetical protein